MRTLNDDPVWVQDLVAGLRRDRDRIRIAHGEANRFPWMDPRSLCIEVDAYAKLPRPPDGHLKEAWRLLAEDLRATTSALGSNVRSAAGKPLTAAVDALTDGPNLIFFPQGRLKLRRSSSRLSRALLNRECVIASWVDVRETHSDPDAAPEDCDWRRRIWASLCRSVGFDPGSLAWKISDVLSGSALDIELERTRLAGDTSHIDVRAFIGRESELSAEERWKLCSEIIAQPPQPSLHVVWLTIERARVQSGVVHVGDVTFYDGHWWRGATSTDFPASEPKPSELESDSNWLLELPKTEEFVLARVATSGSFPGDAVEQSFERVAALLALAAFHEGQTSWEIQTGYSMFSNGRRTGASGKSLPKSEMNKIIRRPADDRTAERLKDLSQRLPSPLPRTGMLADAVEGLLWFQQAKEMPDAARLALSLRVLDQIAGALGAKGITWNRFMKTEMKSTYMWGQVISEIDYLMRVVNDRVRSSFYRTAPSVELKQLAEDLNPDDSESLSRPRFISAVKQFATHADLEAPLARDLRSLARRIATGRSTAAWMNQLGDEYDLLVDRTRRVRNAIIHGGPIVPEAVTSVLPCLAITTVNALHIWIEGELRGLKLSRAIARNRRRTDRCHRELRNGYRPERALIWEPSERIG